MLRQPSQGKIKHNCTSLHTFLAVALQHRELVKIGEQSV